MIDIVLATYNGERYLREQIKSIQNNVKYNELVARFIVVDDGSTDNTEAIVKECSLTDLKIEWVINTSGLHGPSNNFSYGLSLTTAEYIMLSDQDDIWLPEKILTSFKELNKFSNKPKKTPALVFSDKLIVDEQLDVICESYLTLKNISRNWYLKLDNLAHQNVASGCTILLNRTLLVKALPIPEKAYMHDWWLMLVARSCGEIRFIEQPLTQYRQHENNTLGANKVSKWNRIVEFRKHLKAFDISFLKTINQAQAFRQFEIDQQLPINQTIEVLANVHSLSRFQRIQLFVNNTLTRSHLFGKIALLIVLVKLKVDK